MNRDKPKIFLDTDPGGDDAFALLWLLSLVRQGWAELVAIAAVEGNVSAALTFAGTSKLLALARFQDIELGRGVINLEQALADASDVHGQDGLGNLTTLLPPTCHDYETAPYGDDLLIRKLQATPGEITVIAIAPLTNLAAAEKKCPGVLGLAKEIIIMGGAFFVAGNVTPEAEFNLIYDVNAAEIVLASRDDLVILPLDVTRKLIFSLDMAREAVRDDPEHAIAKFIIALCDFMTRQTLSFRETAGKPGFLVHDAVTLAYLFYPELIQFRRGKVAIETQGKQTLGKTLLDRRHQAKSSANAWVALEVDADNLLAILIEDLKQLFQN